MVAHRLACMGMRDDPYGYQLALDEDDTRRRTGFGTGFGSARCGVLHGARRHRFDLGTSKCLGCPILLTETIRDISYRVISDAAG